MLAATRVSSTSRPPRPCAAACRALCKTGGGGGAELAAGLLPSPAGETFPGAPPLLLLLLLLLLLNGKGVRVALCSALSLPSKVVDEATGADAILLGGSKDGEAAACIGRCTGVGGNAAGGGGAWREARGGRSSLLVEEVFGFENWPRRLLSGARSRCDIPSTAGEVD